MSETCLDKVVGLSSNTCACFEDGRPEDFNESLSGYFIDDPEYGFPLRIPQSIQECGEAGATMWDIMDRARTAGINQFKTDFGAALLSGPLKRKLQPFNDWIGRASHNMNLQGLGSKVAVKFCPIAYKGVIAKIFKIELYIQGRNGDTITVDVYDEAGIISAGDPLGSIDIVIANNKGSGIFPEAVVHDFMNDYSQKNDLYIVYDRGTGTPRNNTIRCATCPGSKDVWDKYFTATGVTGSTLDSLRTANKSSYSYGLRVNTGVSCGSSWLCQNFDYDNDDWARVMAEAISLYGLKKLIGIIMTDPGPNRYTQLTREEIALQRDRINKLLEMRMPWLAENVPGHATDCFICNSSISKIELMV